MKVKVWCLEQPWLLVLLLLTTRLKTAHSRRCLFTFQSGVSLDFTSSSRGRGLTLLQSFYANNIQECKTACCADQRCNAMVFYHVRSELSSGATNCFIVHCNAILRCQAVEKADYYVYWTGEVPIIQPRSTTTTATTTTTTTTTSTTTTDMVKNGTATFPFVNKTTSRLPLTFTNATVTFTNATVILQNTIQPVNPSTQVATMLENTSNVTIAKSPAPIQWVDTTFDNSSLTSFATTTGVSSISTSTTTTPYSTSTSSRTVKATSPSTALSTKFTLGPSATLLVNSDHKLPTGDLIDQPSKSGNPFLNVTVLPDTYRKDVEYAYRVLIFIAVFGSILLVVTVYIMWKSHREVRYRRYKEIIFLLHDQDEMYA